MAEWGLLGTHLAVGAETPPLVFEAVGLPGIAPSYAEGWFPVPKYVPVEPGPSPTPRDALRANGVEGSAVSVEPLPEDVGVAALAARLKRLTEESCALGWIADARVCRTLGAKLDRADKAALQSFVAQLAQEHALERGEHVSDNAYWLLKINAEYLLSRL